MFPDDTSAATENDYAFPAVLGIPDTKSGVETSLPPLKTEITPAGDNVNPRGIVRLPPLVNTPVLPGTAKRAPRRYQSNIGMVPNPFVTDQRKTRVRRHKTQGQLDTADIDMDLGNSSPFMTTKVRPGRKHRDIAGYGLQMESGEDGSDINIPSPHPPPVGKRFTSLEISTAGDSDFQPTRSSSGLTTILLPDMKNRNWSKLKGLYAFKPSANQS